MNRVPPLSHSYKLARYLGVSLEYLIAGRSPDNADSTNEDILALLKKVSEELTNYV